MIARIRGEHDTRWGRWGPVAAHDAGTGGASQPTTAPWPHVATAVRARRRLVATMAATATIAMACVATAGLLSSGPARAAPGDPSGMAGCL